MTLHVHERGLLPSLEGASLIAFHILAPYMRGWRFRWGATPEDRQLVFPCDEVIAEPRWSYTHAITIQAPQECVWPWLVQMGDGRAGLYSYESLENLAGCKMNNRSEIVPELQSLKLGDEIKLHDKIPGLPVIYLEPGRVLVIGGANGATDGAGATWGWLLQPGENGQTRLIERWRTVYPLTTANRLGYGQLFVEPITFVMARKMMLGIKARAEALAQGTLVPQPA
ncbi:MAG: hypothetical protein U0452_03295 [Anaerolineae bacterium]